MFFSIFDEKKILMQVLRLIEASEAVLEEKQWQQFAASGSCTVSTNEKPRSIVQECSRGGGRIPCFQAKVLKFIFIHNISTDSPA